MDAQVVSLLGNFWLAKIGASTTCWRIYDNITSMWIWTNINHFFVFLVQRQQFWHIIFWWGLTITKDFHDSVFICESSLPYNNYSWIPCMTIIVIVKPQKISLSKPNVKLPLGMIWTYNFNFMIFNSLNNLLIGYKWSTRVNDKLLQKDISEDHASS